MTDLIMGLGSVLQHDINRVNAIAQNIASSTLIGYKSIRSFTALTRSSELDTAPSLATIESHSVVNSTQAGFRVTGLRSDLALSGPSWFLLQTDQGLRLSRNGHFHRDASGMLVNTAGYAVLGDDGPLHIDAAIDANSNDMRVSPEGVVRVGEQVLGRLRIVSVQQNSPLKAVGGGLYSAADFALASATNYSVHQGVLENANVDVAAEMVQLMQASRHVESVQRALAAYDDLLGRGINQLGKD